MNRGIAAAVAVATAASPARAQCVLDGVTGAAFGSYDPLASAPLDTTGSITYKCLVALTITIDISTGSSASYAARTMARTGGGTTLSYNLYLDAGRMFVWGNGGNGTAHYGPVLGLLSDVTLMVFARAVARQDVSTGSYGDVVVVTLNY